MATSPQTTAITLLLLFTAVGILALMRLTPPAAVPAGAPATAFSAARAVTHLRVIAARPHPKGSPAQTAVRAYLVREVAAMGYAPVVYTAMEDGAVVHNVLARVPGKSGTAILFDAHYDSSRRGPGAGDNGVAVAALLETLRALRAAPPPRNDLIMAFTDGEETGLLGARTMLRHPWMRDVAAVCNFDARGTRGPVLLYETGPHSGGLIGAFARAVPHPQADSLSDAVYQLMPNRTHFTIYKGAGYPGLNFAFIDGARYYHTPDDTVANVDPRTVQHVGDIMLGLARHFGTADLDAVTHRGGDAVYGTLLGRLVFHYPVWLVVPLLVAAGVLAVIILAAGLRARALSLGGIAVGCGYLLLMATVALLVSTMAQSLAIAIEHRFIAALAIAAVLAGLAYRLVRWRVPLPSLAAGMALLWLVLAGVMAVALPAGSHLFFWPALLGWFGIGAAVLVRRFDRNSLYIVPAALLAILLWCPMLTLMFTAVPDIFPGYVVLAMLVLGWVLCSLDVLFTPSRPRCAHTP